MHETDVCPILGLGRSPRGGHGNLPQDSCLENPMDRGAWGATVHGITGLGHDRSGLACMCAYISIAFSPILGWLYSNPLLLYLFLFRHECPRAGPHACITTVSLANSVHFTPMWNWAGPCGAPEHGSFSVPFLVCRGQPPTSITFPESKRQVQTVANQGRDKGETVRKHQHSQGPGPPGTKAPSKWQMSAFFIPEKTTRGEIKGTKEAHQEIKRSPETRLEECRPCTRRTVSATLPLNHCNKNSSPNPPRLRHTASKDNSPLCPLLPGKAIQLFFSILPKTLSEIQFSTGKQRLSFQHHMCSKLVEGTRGRRKFPFFPFTRSPTKWYN